MCTAATLILGVSMLRRLPIYVRSMLMLYKLYFGCYYIIIIHVNYFGGFFYGCEDRPLNCMPNLIPTNFPAIRYFAVLDGEK